MKIIKTGNYGQKLVYSLFGVILLMMTGGPAQASQAEMLKQIQAFAACSQQCVNENEACHDELAKECGQKGSDCYEKCNVEYPQCMAKCPKPTLPK